MMQANLLQYFRKKSESGLFSVVGGASDSQSNKEEDEGTAAKKPKKSLSLKKKKTAVEKSRSRSRAKPLTGQGAKRSACGLEVMSGRQKIIQSSTNTVSSETGQLVPATSQAGAMVDSARSSSSSLQTTDEVNTENLNSVKRNLFGAATPTTLTEPSIDDISLPLINFSFHSPVKKEEVAMIEDVSIHDSVSLTVNKLPSLGGGDIAAMEDNTDLNDAEGYGHDCIEDDQWMEGISSSQWEGHVAEPCDSVSVAKLRRYIVQSITPRQRLDQQDDMATRSSQEIVLELKPVASSNTTSSGDTCLLRDDWLDTELLPGNKIQLVGCCDNTPTACHTHIIDNTLGRYLIVVPDRLVSATTMATATGCMRRAVLAEIFKETGGNEIMLVGSLLHQVFEQVLTNHHGDDVITRAHMMQLIHETVKTFPNLMSMYGVGVSQDHMTTKLLDYVPMLLQWIEQFMSHTPQPGKGQIEFKRTHPGCHGDSDWMETCSVGVSGVHDIEECIWSPRYGLKGKVDATVEVKIHTVRRPRNPQSHLPAQDVLEQFTVPLELKTGKMTSPLGSVEHRAQVILYTLMMSEHYDGEVPGGLLYYLKAGHMVGVPAFDHEIRALVMMRNRLASYLHYCYTDHMPEMLRHPRTCRYCPMLRPCCVFHKSVEGGTAVTSSLGELFDDSTHHVTDGYRDFFCHWYRLTCLEVWHCHGNSNDALWAQDTRKRVEQGVCLTHLTTGQVSHQSDGSIVQAFHRSSDASLSPPWGGDSLFVIGERMIVSRQDGKGWGVATGYIKQLHTTTIDIVVNKSLAPGDGTLYRLDISQSNITGHTLLSNMMSLMMSSNERGQRLRELLIDSVEPVFDDGNCYYDNRLVSSLNDGQKKAIHKVMSSRDYTIILGMPGTGKTLTIATLVRALVSNGNSVLLSSYTNTAIDNILLKLAQMGVDFLRLGSAHKVHPNLVGYTTAAMATSVSSLGDLQNVLDSKLVVATTCLGLNHVIFGRRVFDYCIIDEASQVTLPVCVGALQYASQSFVLVGDHHQLPPLVQSDKARTEGLGVSLFQLLVSRHPSAVVSLWQQFRMNRDIMLLSNTLVYDNKMQCGSEAVAMATLQLSKWALKKDTLSDWLHRAIDPAHSVVFVNTDKVSGGGAETKGSCDQIYNELEADLVVKLITSLISCGCSGDDIGVITPYRQQQHLIRSCLYSSNVQVSPVKLPTHSQHTTCNGVEVFTVDRYQGRDKPCIIVSFVRSNPDANVGGLLPDINRINVAMTRGRHKLIMIGSHDTLRHAHPLANLFVLLRQHNMMYNVTQHR